jgi:Cdc6-like AAA superfamily ATPase
VLVSNDNKSCNLVEYLGAELYERERQREWVENPGLFQLHRFTFDYVFDMDSSQQEVYETTAKPAVISILQGYNSTIFAYGQTGTGKTFTMEGFTYNSTDSQRGIIPRSIEEIFNYIESFSSHDTKFMVRASYLQIYNESISDLLKPEKTSLQIREDKKRGVFVEGLSEWAVRSPSDIYTLLQRGASSRATASTKMNDVSSRSHAVFVVTVEQMTIVDDGRGEALTQIKVGKLNMVDLAGSERIRVTGATGKQLEESKKINKSLSALGNVIYALTDSKGRTHIPYRDSKVIYKF